MSAEDSPHDGTDASTSEAGTPDAGTPDASAPDAGESAENTERLAELTRRWEADPTSKVYLQLAEEYRKAERYAEAIDVLEKSLEHRPRDPRGRVALARCRMETGDVPEAAELLEHVTRQDPAHVVANKLLLEVYLQLGDAEKAAERLNIYRLLNDRDPELDHFEYRLERLKELATTRAGDAFRPASDDPTPTEQIEALAAEATGSQPAAQTPSPQSPIPSAVPVPPPVASLEPELVAEEPAFELEPIEPSEPDAPPSFEMLEAPETPDEPTFDDVVESPRDDDEPTFDDVVESPRDDDEPTFDDISSADPADDSIDLETEPTAEAPTETPPPAPTLGGYEPAPEIEAEIEAEPEPEALFDLAPPPAPDLDDLFGLGAGEPAPAPDLDNLWAAEPSSEEAEEDEDRDEASETDEADGEEPATVTLGQLYLQQGHFDEAERIFQEILDRDPDHEAARDGLSIIQARRLADESDAEEREAEGSASEPQPVEDLAFGEPTSEEPAPIEEPTFEEPAPVEEPPPAEEPPPIDEPDDEPTPVEEPPVEEPPVEEPSISGDASDTGAETTGVTAARLLARRDIDEHPEGLTDKKILVLRQYAKHLRRGEERGEEHVS